MEPGLLIAADDKLYEIAKLIKWKTFCLILAPINFNRSDKGSRPENYVKSDFTITVESLPDSKICLSKEENRHIGVRDILEYLQKICIG